MEIDMAGQGLGFSRDCLGSSAARIMAAFGVAASLSGCLGYEGVINRGAVVDTRKVMQVKPGMAAPQVMQLLGTPSTTSTIGGDAWYYVSQRVERSLAFMPQSITDQHVLAVYFDKSRKVTRVADYGMEDGKPVDFLSRTTPVAGPEYHLIQALLSKVPF
ncbi:outer membrane protein assembly factor BamE [Methylocystis sp. MJC1]|jgi:outer membrane protein assembly factor BamE (lipoprotein component of BamABCDE complex)|nr:outer membrane protein assembly factor BamE [Methylocystis sp. MJC1]